MRCENIQKIIKTGAGFLKKSINNYFPGSSGNKTLPENNVVLHIGAAFLKNGFTLFAEHSFKYKKLIKLKEDKYLDLVVLRRKNGIEIRIECSEFQNAGKLEKISKDVERIKRFKLVDTREGTNEIDSYKHKFGILLAHSSNKNIIDWWGNDSTDPPKGVRKTKYEKKRKKLWKELKKFIRINIYGSCVLDENWSPQAGYRKLVLLYIIFKIKEAKFN